MNDEIPQMDQRTLEIRNATLGKLLNYQCHKVVRAAKIDKITRYPDGSASLYVTIRGGGHCIPTTQAWLNSRKADAGGYFVVYDDGYESYSPAKAFEDGYSELSPL